MPLTKTSRALRIALGMILVSTVAAITWAQTPAKPASDKARPRMEYVHQEVQADAVVQTLNDLDGQGWDIFQIVPTWQFKNENNEGVLAPKTYQVFGRRAKDAR